MIVMDHNPAHIDSYGTEADLILSGHTHIKQDVTVSGIRCLNPGSVSIPKDGSHSCMVYENGEFTVRILED